MTAPSESTVILTFNQGSTDGTVACEPFTPYDDDILEDSETFQVSLASPTGGAGLASPTTATVTITDDDSKEVIYAEKKKKGPNRSPLILKDHTEPRECMCTICKEFSWKLYVLVHDFLPRMNHAILTYNSQEEMHVMESPSMNACLKLTMAEYLWSSHVIMTPTDQ